MLSQTFVIATQGYPAYPATKDLDWPSCLACAIVDRARERSGVARSGICTTCLNRYCWDGSAVTTATSGSHRRVSINHLFEFAVVSALWTMMLM
jgi:lysophospholipase